MHTNSSFGDIICPPFTQPFKFGLKDEHVYTVTHCFQFSDLGGGVELGIHTVPSLAHRLDFGQIVDVLESASWVAPGLGYDVLHLIIVLCRDTHTLLVHITILYMYTP